MIGKSKNIEPIEVYGFLFKKLNVGVIQALIIFQYFVQYIFFLSRTPEDSGQSCVSSALRTVFSEHGPSGTTLQSLEWLVMYPLILKQKVKLYTCESN